MLVAQQPQFMYSLAPPLLLPISDPAVDRIVVDGPIRLEAEHFSPDAPIRLTRNLTITSDAGPHQVLMLLIRGRKGGQKSSMADCACQRSARHYLNMILSF